jgi:ribose transport system permease protein
MQEEQGVRRRSLVIDLWDRVGLLTLVLVSWLIFSVFADGFVSDFNIFAVGRAVAVSVVIGLAQMVVIATGGMNISVGAIGGVSAMFTGWLLEGVGVPVPIAILGGVGMGAALGAINGILIVKTGINSFIITLGTLSVFSGLMYVITKVQAFNNLPVDFINLGQTRWLGVSPLVWAMVVTGACLWFLYRGTTLGRQMLATGANPRAARLSGVPVNRIIAVTHVLSGALAGLAGVMLLLRLGSAIPTIGSDWVLPSFAAPAVGGTLLSGGVVSVVGTFVGGLLLATIGNGLTLMNIPSFWVELTTGLVLLIAVLLDRARTLAVTRSRIGVIQPAGKPADPKGAIS